MSDHVDYLSDSSNSMHSDDDFLPTDKESVDVVIRKVELPSVVRRLSVKDVFFVLICLIQLCIFIVAGVTDLALNWNNGDLSWVSIAMKIVICFLFLVLGLFALDALIGESKIQLISYGVIVIVILLTMLANMIYETIQSVRIRNKKSTIQRVLIMIIPNLIVLILQGCNSILLWHISRRFGWQRFKVVGADSRRIQSYHVYLVFSTITKLDSAIILSILLLNALTVNFHYHPYAYFPVLFILFIISILNPLSQIYVIAPGEKRKLHSISFFWDFFVGLYFLYQTVHSIVMWSHGDDFYGVPFPSTSREKRFSVNIVFMSISGIIVMVILFLSKATKIISGIVMSYFFGRGLKSCLQ